MRYRMTADAVVSAFCERPGLISAPVFSTVASPARRGNLPARPVLFQGEAERKQYFEWLSAFPNKSKAKIRAINRAARSPNFPASVTHNVKHIVMALRGAFFDGSIRALIEEIISLRQQKYWASRTVRYLQADSQPPARQRELEKAIHTLAKSEEALQDFHIAIDWATGDAKPFEIPKRYFPLVETLPDPTVLLKDFSNRH